MKQYGSFCCHCGLNHIQIPWNVDRKDFYVMCGEQPILMEYEDHSYWDPDYGEWYECGWHVSRIEDKEIENESNRNS